MFLLSIKRMMVSLAFLFLLSSCASNSYKNEITEETQITDEANSKEIEGIKRNLRSLLVEPLEEQKKLELSNEQESPMFENEESRKYYLDLISKYIRKIQIEYNDTYLEGYYSWAMPKYKLTRSALEFSLQTVSNDDYYSGLNRWAVADMLGLYVKKMDAHLNKVKKRKSKDKV